MAKRIWLSASDLDHERDGGCADDIMAITAATRDACASRQAELMQLTNIHAP